MSAATAPRDVPTGSVAWCAGRRVTTSSVSIFPWALHCRRPDMRRGPSSATETEGEMSGYLGSRGGRFP